ncbi:hypothetical protein MJT46_003848 [Ovis ammon polii x Ovis aries]|nr:hypothetical protein MJT46_003848 [Ovis ammon polii x Ovis aries]
MQRGDSLPPATVEPGPGTAAHPLLAFPDAAKGQGIFCLRVQACPILLENKEEKRNGAKEPTNLLHCRVELYQKVVILYAGHNLTGEEEEAEAKGQQEELTPSSRTCRCDGYHESSPGPGHTSSVASKPAPQGATCEALDKSSPTGPVAWCV